MQRELKPCPFCGSGGILIQDPLWHGGHGYRGEYEVYVKCCNPSCEVYLPHARYNTLGMSMKEAQDSAIKDWNRRNGK